MKWGRVESVWLGGLGWDAVGQDGVKLGRVAGVECGIVEQGTIGGWGGWGGSADGLEKRWVQPHNPVPPQSQRMWRQLRGVCPDGLVLVHASAGVHCGESMKVLRGLDFMVNGLP